MEGASGSILIDGVDTARLPLHTLRSAIAIIPQSPVIFSNTLRYNLDPFHQCSDSALWDALEAVQLKEMVSRLSAKLSTPMSEGGANFSVGECQLLCVARAILKPSRLLLVDEATANVDRRTDALLQEVIRTKFKDRTGQTQLSQLVDACPTLSLFSAFCRVPPSSTFPDFQMCPCVVCCVGAVLCCQQSSPSLIVC